MNYRIWCGFPAQSRFPQNLNTPPKKYLIMKTKTTVLSCGLVIAVLAAVSSAHAALVTWGPSTDYVTTTSSGQRSAAGGVIAFDLGTPLTPSSGYTGDPIYGGASSTDSMNGGFSIRNNDANNGGGNDTLFFGKATSVANGDVLSGVFLWKKEDFGFGEGENVTVESFSYTGRVNGSTSTGSEARFVIQQGSDYLISGAIGLTTTNTSYSLADVATQSWFTYNPGSNFSVIGSLVEAPVFSGVTALGLYMTTTSTGTNGIYLAFSQFGADGFSVIPEPSSAALWLSLAALGLVARRNVQRVRS